MKSSLLTLGLLFCLTFSVGPANAQQSTEMAPPAANAVAPYAVPPQVPQGGSTAQLSPAVYGGAPLQMQVPPAAYGGAPVQMQMPPPAYGGGDPSQMYQGQPPPQFQQWGSPQQPGMPQAAPPMQNGYPPQGASGPDPGMLLSPPRMSAYEQQEAAIREAQLSEQLEDVRQQKEMEEGFRHGVLAELNDDSKSNGTTSGFNGDQSKMKTGVTKTKNVLKNGMRWCAPTASYIGTFFILRGITGGF
jgi:hypothetical protein